MIHVYNTFSKLLLVNLVLYGMDPTISKKRIAELSDDTQFSLCIPLVKRYLSDHSSDDRKTFMKKISKAYGFSTETLERAFEYVESGGRNLLLKKKKNVN